MGGIPCVSHLWIRDCCNMNKVLDYQSYLLPAGINIETMRLQEWSNSSGCLRGSYAVISSTNNRFLNLWLDVLKTSGADVIRDNELSSQPTLEELAVLDFVI